MTVLYIPQDDLMQSESALSDDKSIIPRLEASLIHWTRQIKEVYNVHSGSCLLSSVQSLLSGVFDVFGGFQIQCHSVNFDVKGIPD